jgi:hypothetical protein
METVFSHSQCSFGVIHTSMSVTQSAVLQQSYCAKRDPILDKHVQNRAVVCGSA